MSPMLPKTTLPRGPGATRAVGVVSPVLVAITDLPCSFFLATADPYGVVVTARRSPRGPSPTGRPLLSHKPTCEGCIVYLIASTSSPTLHLYSAESISKLHGMKTHVAFLHNEPLD